MGTNSKGKYCVEIGNMYELDVMNYGPGFKPYGIIGGMPVIIGKCHDASKNLEPYKTQPGDSVIVRVNDLVGECAFADEVQKLGTYINKGDKGDVTLTGQSNHDARDSISAPEDGGGYCGIFTLVKYVNPEHPGIENKKRECFVRIGALKEGKGGRYFAITYAVDAKHERPLEREIYVSKWPPENIQLPNWYQKWGDFVPRLRFLRDMKIGIPTINVAMLFFGKDMKKTMITEKGENVDMTDKNPLDAVDTFYRNNADETFRLGLATPDSVCFMRNAIGDSDFNLIAENLPPVKIPKTDKI